VNFKDPGNVRWSSVATATICTSAVVALAVGGAQAVARAAQPRGHIGSPATLRTTGLPAAIRTSWMTPGAAKGDLAYVSNALTKDVYVYSWPHLKLEGTLTGFGSPGGECVDKDGNVWIADQGAQTMVKYPHGGTAPSATLPDSSGVPDGCAVDPTTGNLAVTNLFDVTPSGGQTQGAVLVYPNGSGSPTSYQDAGMYFYDFCGYDPHGNLFLDGINSVSSDEFTFAELQKGNTRFTPIKLNQYINYPGGVQWHGKHVAVSDQLSTPGTIYEFSISGSNGTLVGKTPLTDGDDIAQFFIDGKLVVGGSYYTTGSTSNVATWHFPAGGAPVTNVPGPSRALFGAVVSRAKK
jgi:hypothetical protein